MQLVLTYFITLTCLVVDSEVAMDPGILGLRERPGGSGDTGNTRFCRFFIDFVNFGIFKADFTWVPLNLVKLL